LSTEFSHCLNRLQSGSHLNEDQSYHACLSFFNEEISHDDIVLFLQLLSNKGETSDELLGFIRAMRERMDTISFSQSQIIDICGTGGSLPNRFNVSTCAALVIGSLGFHVAKHGNRGSKKPNGSFDFLDAMKIPYELTPADHQYRINDYGATFLFARTFHKAVASVAPARKELTGRSIFNLIGPFCNPASPHVQIVGTPSKDVAKMLFNVGKSLPYERFAVISSDIGLDEVSTVGLSQILILRNGTSYEITIDPTEFGINHSLSDISVSPDAIANDNAEVFKDIIRHRSTDHPISELICLNAAVMMHIANNTKSIETYYHDATKVIASGKLDSLLNH